jgi:DNA-binding NtrC family response regulator
VAGKTLPFRDVVESSEGYSGDCLRKYGSLASGAAVKLGMPATTLYSKIQSLKIDKRRFKRD